MNSLTEEDSKKCWDLLAYVLTFGRTCSFVYSKEPQEYILSHGIGSGLGYVDYSSEEYLLDDIQFALFNEKRPYIQLQLKGRESGPVFDVWYFIFTKEGLVKAESYYSTD